MSINFPTLNSYATYDPCAMQLSNQRYSTLWKIAAIASTVAFVALAAFTVMYTSLFLPGHVLTASLGITLLLPTAVNFLQFLWEKSALYAKKARTDGKLIKQINNPSKPPGILINVTGRAKTNLLAEYQLEEERFTTQLKKGAMTMEKRSIASTNFLNPKDKLAFIISLQQISNTKNRDLKAALCRIKQACLLRFMNNPSDTKPINLPFVPLSHTSRIIAKDNEDPDHDRLIQHPFKLSIQEVLNQNPVDLYKKMFPPEEVKA